jgi:hypothetical protein
MWNESAIVYTFAFSKEPQCSSHPRNMTTRSGLTHLFSQSERLTLVVVSLRLQPLLALFHACPAYKVFR